MELFAVLKIHTTDEIWRGKGNVVDLLATEDIIVLKITIFTGFEAHSYTYPHILTHGYGSAFQH
jgi:hypothetical protein